MSGTDLAIPTTRELEALGPTDRWDLEDKLMHAEDMLRAFNDEELRRWVEVDGKTQTEIAEMVGRSQSQIQRRCDRLDVRPASNRGRPRITPTGNSDEPPVPADDEPEPIEGEVVVPQPSPQSAPPRVKCPTCGHMVNPDEIGVWE